MQAYLKITEAAKLLGMTPRAVSRLVADGRIAVHYLGPRGGMVRFTEPDLEDYLASCRVFGPKSKSRAASRPKASRGPASRSVEAKLSDPGAPKAATPEQRQLRVSLPRSQTTPSSNGE